MSARAERAFRLAGWALIIVSTVVIAHIYLVRWMAPPPVKPRPKYGDPCEPPRPGCFYLGDDFTGMPTQEVFFDAGGAR